MMLLRKAEQSDLAEIFRLAKKSGIGITTLPKEIDVLELRLQWAIQSFSKQVSAPNNEYYLFVLEDTINATLIGISAIEAAIGSSTPCYYYKISEHANVCHKLNIQSHYQMLSLVDSHNGCSEMCTLFLDPAHRKDHNGALLSRARFLFMANNPERFADTVIAEIRGVCSDNGHSPFWDAVGEHFFHITFAQADRLKLIAHNPAIVDLIPKHPLYVPLLAKAAQAVIGKPHATSIPAMHLLLDENFTFQHYIDVFDAGPTVEAARDTITTIKTSVLFTIENISADVGNVPCLMSNVTGDFRATLTHANINHAARSVIINNKTAQLLKLSRGDVLRLAPLHNES